MNNNYTEHFLVNINSSDLPGWFSFIIITLIILLIVKKNPTTKNFLLTALFLRSLCVIIDQYFYYLPGSMMDGWTFEHIAFDYSQNYGFTIIYSLFDGSSYFLSKLVSILYTLLETRSPMMANMISVGVGTAAVYLIYYLTLIIWGRDAALKAGWFATFFPTLVLYSAIMMREIYVVFFTTYALIGCVSFINNKKFIHFAKSIIGFFGAALFHGPVILGLFVFLLYIFFTTIRENNYFLRFKKKKLFLIFIIPLYIIPIISFFLGHYSIPKIGNINNLGDIKINDLTIDNKKNHLSIDYIKDRIVWKIQKATRSTFDDGSGSEFPSWTIPENLKEITYLTPVRMLYFLYAPFPWDIKNFSHMIGLFDVIFYIYLSTCILFNLKTLFKNPKTRFLILILLVYILIYSFGVGNFGTSIRHRAKFVEIFIVLAAPIMKKINFKRFRFD